MTISGDSRPVDASLQTILHPATFRDPGVLATIGRELEDGRAVVIADAFDEALALRAHAALERCTTWQRYEGYEPFFQFHHHNLYGVENLPPEVLDCGRVLGSTPTRLLLSVLTGADCRGPLTLAASLYLPGDYSLPHTDACGARSLAYVWYLTKGWLPEWGGHFVWCPTGAVVNPTFNSLVLFKVTETSLHFVAPVSRHARGRRLSVNGWWNASIPRVPAAKDTAPAFSSALQLAPGPYGARVPSFAGRDDIVVL